VANRFAALFALLSASFQNRHYQKIFGLCPEGHDRQQQKKKPPGREPSG
jgi:hypothetical protein